MRTTHFQTKPKRICHQPLAKVLQHARLQISTNKVQRHEPKQWPGKVVREGWALLGSCGTPLGHPKKTLEHLGTPRTALGHP
jgi:hypothetical protein